MRRVPDTYGDNFPATDGSSWNPRIPWRHGHVMPSAVPTWLPRLGWWTVVTILMGLLVFLVVRDA